MTSCTTAPAGTSTRTGSFFAEVIGESVLLTRSADDASCTLASGPDTVLQALREVSETERISVTYEALPEPAFPPIPEGRITTGQVAIVRDQIVAPWCDASGLFWITSFARTNPTVQEQGSITILHGGELRPLPFRLDLAAQQRPASLGEMVDLLYDAIPPDHLRVIGAYFGGRDHDRLRARYDASIDFFQSLYMPEILAEAQRTWRLRQDSRLFDAIECVGENCPYLVALQIGVTSHSADRAAAVTTLSDRAQVFSSSASIAARLFEVCDQAARP